ncbi:MAG: L,D-transpeptidase family protein [Clostridia bacterium]|nr:L,D-transpeptidase family protein [Clostridia bacterium]
MADDNKNIEDLAEDDFAPISVTEDVEPEIPIPEEELNAEPYDEEISEEDNGESEKESGGYFKKFSVSPQTKKRLIVGACAAAGVLAAVYVGGAVYYSSHFLPGTTINSFKCSNMNIDAAAQAITSGVENYTYVLKERGGKEESISGNDIDLKLETIGNLQEPLDAQNNWKWFFDRKNIHERINIIVTMNEDKLYQKVGELECISETKEQMTGATSLVTYDEETHRFILIEDNITDDSGSTVFGAKEKPQSEFDVSRERVVFGENIVSMNKLFDSVKAGIYGLYPDMSLETEGCYISMSEESNMKQALDTMNRYISTKVSYQHGDEIIPLDGGSIHLWVTVDDNYNVYLDEDQVSGFVRDLSVKYNTIGTERRFVTTDGEEIGVSGGDYGWKVDIEDETAELCEIIKSGEEVSREPVYEQKAASHGSIDVGNTYAEISIGGQHLWFYQDGELKVSSDIVSGNPYAGNATPGGLYKLKYKERNSVLVGDTYRTPVSYWMPFNGGIGMHDATWRGSFGGSIYLGGGSHGCINLPLGVAAQMYSLIEPGDPVIVY